MKVEKKLQKYLNQAMEITGDYLTVLSLIEFNPEEILEIESKELRSVASLIYLCRDILTFFILDILFMIIYICIYVFFDIISMEYSFIFQTSVVIFI